MSLQVINTTQQLKIDNVYITDQYHISSFNMPNMVIKDIIFPDTVGRLAMELGAEHTDETSLGVTFSHEPPNENIIYAEHGDAFWSKLSDITGLLTSNITHDVECHLFSVGNMRIQMQLMGKPGVRIIRDQQCIWQAFQLIISQYRA